MMNITINDVTLTETQTKQLVLALGRRYTDLRSRYQSASVEKSSYDPKPIADDMNDVANMLRLLGAESWI